MDGNARVAVAFINTTYKYVYKYNHDVVDVDVDVRGRLPLYTTVSSALSTMVSSSQFSAILWRTGVCGGSPMSCAYS